jgi:hypothetical protein
MSLYQQMYELYKIFIIYWGTISKESLYMKRFLLMIPRNFEMEFLHHYLR